MQIILMTQESIFLPWREFFEVTSGQKLCSVVNTAMIRLFPHHKFVSGITAAVLSVAATIEVSAAQKNLSGVELRDLIAQGDAAYTENQMATAAASYAKAYERLGLADQKMADLIKERYARCLAIMAQDAQKNGNNQSALSFIKQALAVLPSDSYVKSVEKNINKSPQQVVLAVNAGDIGKVAPASGVVTSAGAADRAVARAQENMQKAMDLLNQGRASYAAKQYEDALKSYQAALQVMPDSPATKDRLDFIKSSVGDASVAVAQEYVKVGRTEEARSILDQALEIVPSHVLCQRMLKYLDDPERTNQALSPKHVANVSEVQRLLTLGYGHFDLGNFDAAQTDFENVLRIDPYNVAARRGLESVANRKSQYSRSAYDHTRAQAMAEVDRAWSEQATVDSPEGSEPSSEPVESPYQSIETKLTSIVIPRIDLEDTDISEALEVIRNLAFQNDRSAGDVQSARGVNIMANFGDPNSEEAQRILSKRFNLRMNNVPLKQVLTYLGTMTGTSYRTNAYTVEIVSASDASSDLYSKVISVPLGFFTTNMTGSSSETSDPFAEESSGSISLKRVDPKETLSQMGVTFPEGSSVRFNSDNSTLFVRNTRKNIDLIEDIFALKATQQPVQVVVEATILEVSQKNLKELGFDWILNTDLQEGELFGAGGQDANNEANNNKTIFDSLATAPGTSLPNASVTAGLRSIHQVVTTDSIDSLITNGSRTSQSDSNNNYYTPNRAPAFLTIQGVWNSAQVAFVMRGLDQKKGVDILQKPQVIVRPGENAEFYSGRELIYPVSYEPPQIPNSSGSSYGNSSNMVVTPATPMEFESRRTGTSFNVQVTGISQDKTMIDLAVTPEIVDFEGFIDYGSPIMSPMVGMRNNRNSLSSILSDVTSSDSTESYVTSVELSKNSIVQPIFSKRSISVPVSIASGSTVVIGGLQKGMTTRFEDKVPILGDIPLVGRLFRSEGSQEERSVLLIMVSAKVVDAGGRSIFAAQDSSSYNEEENTVAADPTPGASQEDNSGEPEIPQP